MTEWEGDLNLYIFPFVFIIITAILFLTLCIFYFVHIDNWQENNKTFV